MLAEQDTGDVAAGVGGDGDRDERDHAPDAGVVDVEAERRRGAALTEERRKEYIKLARSKAEDGRVSVRNVRRTAKQALEKLEKDGEVGKDDVTGAEKRLDAMTKTHTDKIDDLLKHKEAELLEV